MHGKPINHPNSAADWEKVEAVLLVTVGLWDYRGYPGAVLGVRTPCLLLGDFTLHKGGKTFTQTPTLSSFRNPVSNPVTEM